MSLTKDGRGSRCFLFDSFNLKFRVSPFTHVLHLFCGLFKKDAVGGESFYLSSHTHSVGFPVSVYIYIFVQYLFVMLLFVVPVSTRGHCCSKKLGAWTPQPCWDQQVKQPGKYGVTQRMIGDDSHP